MDVSELLEKKGGDVVTVPADGSIREAAKTLTANRIGALVVTDTAGGMAGILSERDISKGIDRYGEEVVDKQVSALMTSKVVSCTADSSLIDVLALMNANNIRHIPVLEENAVIGMISIRDATNIWMNALEEENETLRRLVAKQA